MNHFTPVLHPTFYPQLLQPPHSLFSCSCFYTHQQIPSTPPLTLPQPMHPYPSPTSSIPYPTHPYHLHLYLPTYTLFQLYSHHHPIPSNQPSHTPTHSPLPPPITPTTCIFHSSHIVLPPCHLLSLPTLSGKVLSLCKCLGKNLSQTFLKVSCHF